MILKVKMLKRMISMLCVAGISVSCVCYSVGAVNVAPSMNSDQSLLDEVRRLNTGLDNLSNNVKKFRDKIRKFCETLRVKVGDKVIIQNKELDDNMRALDQDFLKFENYVNEVKGTNGVRNKDSVISLDVYVGMVSREIEKYLALSDLELAWQRSYIRRDVSIYEKIMRDVVSSMMNSGSNSQKINNGRVRRQVLNNNNTINNNANNNNNMNINLNDDELVDAGLKILEIRELLSELNNEQNILNRDKFIQNGNFKKVANKFDLEFAGRRGFLNIRPDCGLYPRIAKRFYKNDLNAQGKYVGQYPILNELYESFQQLSDAYIFDNENLNQEQFKNKIHQKAANVNDVLDRIVDLLGL